MILDTSVIVAIDRGTSEEKLQRLDEESPHKIAAVTTTEYYAGAILGTGETTKADAVLDNAEEIAIKDTIAREAGTILAELTEAGTPISMNDIYVAAVGRIYNEPVLTADTDDFQRINDVDVTDWNTY